MNKGIGVSWEPIAAAGGARRVKVCLFNREVCHLTPTLPHWGRGFSVVFRASVCYAHYPLFYLHTPERSTCM